MSYVIEEGIPIPEAMSKGRGGGPRGCRTEWTMTLDRLEPGQSTITGDYKERKAADQFRVWRPEKKFVIRKIAGQGWRVWRTE